MLQVSDLRVFRWYEFESAHSLPHVSEGHKCRRVHGHNFRLQVTVRRRISRPRSAEEASLLSPTGFVADFFDLDALVHPVLQDLDHHYLNEIEGLENPTSERIAFYIAIRLTAALEAQSEALKGVELQQVVVQENESSGAVLELG